jgi:GABA permease
VGSFPDYSRMALGDWAGFSIGWLYWYFWVIVVGIEAIAVAPTVMNIVVLTAVLSVLNSALYISSRMLFALTRHGDAPHGLTETTSHGVPAKAILLGTVVGYVAVLIAYFFPDTVFLFLLNSSGAVALFVYLMIAVSELRMRARLEREDPERLRVKMWLYPYLTYLSIACILAVFVLMALNPDLRTQLLLTLLSVGVVLAAYVLRSRFGGRAPSRTEETASSEPAR